MHFLAFTPFLSRLKYLILQDRWSSLIASTSRSCTQGTRYAVRGKSISIYVRNRQEARRPKSVVPPPFSLLPFAFPIFLFLSPLAPKPASRREGRGAVRGPVSERGGGGKVRSVGRSVDQGDGWRSRERARNRNRNRSRNRHSNREMRDGKTVIREWARWYGLWCDRVVFRHVTCAVRVVKVEGEGCATRWTEAGFHAEMECREKVRSGRM